MYREYNICVYVYGCVWCLYPPGHIAFPGTFVPALVPGLVMCVLKCLGDISLKLGVFSCLRAPAWESMFLSTHVFYISVQVLYLSKQFSLSLAFISIIILFPHSLARILHIEENVPVFANLWNPALSPLANHIQGVELIMNEWMDQCIHVSRCASCTAFIFIFSQLMLLVSECAESSVLGTVNVSLLKSQK